MNNIDFLEVIKDSFNTYLTVGTSRSTAKLKTLHGKIATDLKAKLGNEYSIKAQGYGDDKEGKIDGKYYPKNVDITIYYRGEAVAGYAIKFVVRNYSQNSNNYFENMLGETANIRANSVPYFQVFIIFDKVPYYEKGGRLKRYDIISQHNIDKYIELSNDNPDTNTHIPDKTLFVLLNLKEKAPNYMFENEVDYANYYRSKIDEEGTISYSSKINDIFGSYVTYNDYEDFLESTSDIILRR